MIPFTDDEIYHAVKSNLPKVDCLCKLARRRHQIDWGWDMVRSISNLPGLATDAA